MRLLVCNDLHLKPAASDHNVDAMGVPDDFDAVLIVGDLTHQDSPENVRLAPSFVERIDDDCPVFYLPRNHDHTSMPSRVVEPSPNAHAGHESILELEPVTVVGWGCEARSLTLSLDQRDFDALKLMDGAAWRTPVRADQATVDIESACQAVVTGSSSLGEVADEFDIAGENRAAFHLALDTIPTT